MKTNFLRIITGVLLILVSTMGYASGHQEESFDVTVAMNDEGIGHLTDSKGMTLYYFTKDVRGNSACTDGCLNNWPIFYSELKNLDPSVETSDFTTITRADGEKQTRYKGWPLYYFFADKKPGERNGDRAKDSWFTVPAGGFDVAIGSDSNFGNYLTDGTGKSLYIFAKDNENLSNCEGDCLTKWPVFYTENSVVPSGLNSSDFGVITRDDGMLQTTYNGNPLYYFFNDKMQGDINGHQVKDVWFLISPLK